MNESMADVATTTFVWRAAAICSILVQRRAATLKAGQRVPKKWLNVGGFGDKAVSDPRLTDQILRLSRIGLDLLAELRHQHPQVLRLVDGVRSPDRFQDRAMREDAVCAARQQREEIEFLRCEANLLVLPDHAMAIVVDDEIAHLQATGRCLVLREHPTQRHANPR